MIPANRSGLGRGIEGACVALDGKGMLGDGNAVGFERNMTEVRIEVTMSENDRPGLLRSSMYHRAGLTRARVRVSWRVDCQGRRRYALSALEGELWWEMMAYNSEGNAHKCRHASDDVVNLLANRALGSVLVRLPLITLVQRAAPAPDKIDIRQQTAQSHASTSPHCNVEPALAVYTFDMHRGKLSGVVQVAHNRAVEDAKREECRQLGSQHRIFRSCAPWSSRLAVPWSSCLAATSLDHLPLATAPARRILHAQASICTAQRTVISCAMPAHARVSWRLCPRAPGCFRHAGGAICACAYIVVDAKQCAAVHVEETLVLARKPDSPSAIRGFRCVFITGVVCAEEACVQLGEKV